MSMIDWAKREIELAKGLESRDLEEGEFDYGGACYDSAIKIFKTLIRDGHSGVSVNITKNILNRLIDGKPLTPIEDIDDIWNEIHYNENKKYKSYQCKRMSSLFKDVYDDGRIEYTDNSSFYCVDIKSKSIYYTGLVKEIVSEMFPISMPYMPPDIPIRVYCDDFLTDIKNGDFDTFEIIYLIDPKGEKVDINRYFKEEDHKWIEIDLDEYNTRYNMRIERK